MVKLPDLTNTDRIVDIDAYGNSYYAVSRQGYLYAWGDNSAQQLPSQDNHVGWFAQPVASSYYGPKQTGYKRFARQIVAGNQFGVTLNTLESGQLMSSWGRNDLKQLGQDDTNSTFVPGAVVQDSKYRPVVGESYVCIAAGKEHALALTSYGRVLSWGAHGNVGGGDNRLGFKTEDDAGHPHDITYDDSDKNKNYLRAAYHDERKTFIDIAAGDNFSMALAQGPEGDNNTYLYTFGANDMGQLGNGNEANGHKAFDITEYFNLGDDKIVGITASGKSAAAWTRSGRLYVWGDNVSKKMNAIAPDYIEAPTPVLSNYVIASAVLGGINYAKTSDGEILAWDKHGVRNISSQLTHPAYLVKLTGHNLDKASIWIDADADKLLDDNEQPLDVSCPSETTCYLQVSTSYLTENNVYDIVTMTPHRGIDSHSISTELSNDNRYPSSDDVPLIDADGDEFEKINQQTLSVNTEDVEATKTVDEASADNAEGLKEEPLESDNGGDEDNSLSDEVQSDDTDVNDSAFGGSIDDDSNSDEAKTEAGDESVEDGSEVDGSDDNATNNTECVCVPDSDPGMNSNDCDNAEMGCECSCECNNDGEYCNTVNNADCNVGEDNKLNEVSICECNGDSLPSKIVVDDLLSDFSSSTQIQLIDSRRKSCLNSIGGVNVDNQP